MRPAFKCHLQIGNEIESSTKLVLSSTVSCHLGVEYNSKVTLTSTVNYIGNEIESTSKLVVTLTVICQLYTE